MLVDTNARKGMETNMIRIAVLDDDQNELSFLLKLLETFQQEHTEYSVTVMSFTNPFDLLEYTHDHGGFDVYLLDIIMRNLTGIECAQKLRERGDGGEIVFLTVSHEYGVDAFGVNAVGYLLKPIQPAILSERLLAIFGRINGCHPPLFVKLSGGGMQALHIEKIVYIESFGKKQSVHLTDGQVLSTQMSLAEWQKHLEGCPAFYSPHRSYIVNFEHVTGIDAYALSVGGYKIPVPRALFKTVQNRFFEYLLDKQK